MASSSCTTAAEIEPSEDAVPQTRECQDAVRKKKKSRQKVNFGEALPPCDVDAESVPCFYKEGKEVILEPSRCAGTLSRLRGVTGHVLSATVSGKDVTYDVAVDSTREVVQVPAYWVRPTHILFNVDAADSNFLPMEDILRASPQYRVPVFQRRYCWGEVEWRELWDSIVEAGKEGTNSKQPWYQQCHSLGRLLLFAQPDGTMLVLDGQQRLTTYMLLLAAVRDRLLALGEPKEGSVLTKLLCGSSGKQSRIMPTLDDRADFQCCMTESRAVGTAAVVRAKHMFAALAGNLDATLCRAFSESARLRLCAVTLALRTRENLQSIFENLTNQKRVGPGVELAPIDMVRNFVLEHFPNEAAMRQAHAEYWSPMEKGAGGPEGLSKWLCNFITFKSESSLSGDFMDWWAQGEVTVSRRGATQRLQHLLNAFRKGGLPETPSTVSTASTASTAAWRVTSWRGFQCLFCHKDPE